MTPMQTIYKHTDSKGQYMRIHEGDLAYDLEQPIDPRHSCGQSGDSRCIG